MQVFMSNVGDQGAVPAAAAAGNFVRGYGIHCIRKGRRPEKCDRERTEKMADQKCRTEKTAKAEFRTNAGR